MIVGSDVTTGSITLGLATAQGPAESPAASPASPRPQAVIPRQLGPIDLIRQIGRGGMGEVWLGQHRILQREVAVKFLLAGPADEKGIAMFLEGARLAAAVRHHGLTAILHADVVEGVPYLVMQYVRGASLDDVLQTLGPLSIEQTMAVLHDVHELIATLHERGIVHRDIKPANILLSAQGEVFVTDFGIACNRPAATSEGGQNKALAGTVAYMAPEMFSGVISQRGDIYALAITTYELLAGHVPFTGSLHDIASQHTSQPLPRQPLLQRGVSEAVIDVLQRGAHKNPMFRLKSARHLHQAMLIALGRKDADASVAAHDVLAKLMTRYNEARRSIGQANNTAPLPEQHDPSDTATTYAARLSELAEEKRSRPLAQPLLTPRPAAPVTRGLMHDLPCIHCHHNLRHMPLDASCLECGHAVEKSLSPTRLIFATRQWLHGAARGCRLMILACIGYILIHLIAPGAQQFGFAGVITVVLVFAINWAAFLYGLWLVTRRRDSRMSAVTRVLAIIAVAAMAVAIVAYVVFMQALISAPVGQFNVHAMKDQSHIHHTAVLVSIAALLFYLALTARRVPNNRLWRQGIVLAAVMSIAALSWHALDSSPLFDDVRVVAALFIGRLAFLIWLGGYLWRFGSLFKRAAAHCVDLDALAPPTPPDAG